MPAEENKYTALFIEHIFELLKQLFDDQHEESFFTSNRTLYLLFNRVQGHFADSFPKELELVTMRQLRNKVGKLRDDLLKNSDHSDYIGIKGYPRKIRIVSEEAGESVLNRWCKPPEFED
ncbi:MAG TPA: hypothetical protein VNY07_06185 [Chthoniobacterales bacterium]|jgi:hypothetical protein|nr:hypothetical protein [Chthoniobacterales bacterium]